MRIKCRRPASKKGKIQISFRDLRIRVIIGSVHWTSCFVKRKLKIIAVKQAAMLIDDARINGLIQALQKLDQLVLTNEETCAIIFTGYIYKTEYSALHACNVHGEVTSFFLKAHTAKDTQKMAVFRPFSSCIFFCCVF